METIYTKLITNTLLSKKIYKVIQNYLENRYTHVTTPNLLINKPQTLKAPQGSSYSPQLRNFIVNKLLKTLTSFNILVHVYANDIIVITKTEGFDELESFTSKLTKTVDDSSNKHKRRNRKPSKIQERIINTILKQINTVKYLGIIIDNIQNWNSHTEQLKNKLQ